MKYEHVDGADWITPQGQDSEADCFDPIRAK